MCPRAAPCLPPAPACTSCHKHSLCSRLPHAPASPEPTSAAPLQGWEEPGEKTSQINENTPVFLKMHSVKDALTVPGAPSRQAGMQMPSCQQPVRVDLVQLNNCPCQESRATYAARLQHQQRHPGGTGSSANPQPRCPTSSKIEGQHHSSSRHPSRASSTRLPAPSEKWSGWPRRDTAAPELGVGGHRDPTPPGWQGQASTCPGRARGQHHPWLQDYTSNGASQIPATCCLIYGLINKWGIMLSLSNTCGRVMLSKSHY